MVRRAEWGAAPPNHAARGEFGIYNRFVNPGGWMVYSEPLERVLRSLAVHHSALPNNDDVRDLQRIHLLDRGFADISYHAVIGDDGVLYEGRELNVRGANVARNNTGTIGVCLTGNFETAQPTRAQLATLERLATALRTGLGVTHLAGHRDFPQQATVCPGGNLEPQLPALATRSGLTFGTA